jgi:hypothetical protein
LGDPALAWLGGAGLDQIDGQVAVLAARRRDDGGRMRGDDVQGVLNQAVDVLQRGEERCEVRVAVNARRTLLI